MLRRKVSDAVLRVVLDLEVSGNESEDDYWRPGRGSAEGWFKNGGCFESNDVAKF